MPYSADGLLLDRRGHCAECPPCLDSHTRHCSRHVTPSERAEALEGFADSNRAEFAAYVRGWYPAERAAAILDGWED